MATTTYGSPYVQSSDLVSGWPTASQNVADRIDDVAMKGNGLNAQTGTTYTLVLTDAGKNITRSNGSASTLDIPTNASVAFETGTVVAVTNIGSGAVTIQGAGVTINGPSLVLAQWESARLMKTATDTWVVVKGGGLPKASVSSTTGSPATGANGSRTYYQWTGSGTVTLTAGVCDVLIVGGGGGGGSGQAGAAAGGGGGGGQVLYLTSVYFPAGTHTITVGGGGAGGSTTALTGACGSLSLAGGYIAIGGGAGGGAQQTQSGIPGGNGGGAGGQTTVPGGVTLAGGFAGGNGATAAGNAGGAGAGAGAAGGNSAGTTGVTGGAGASNSITGSSVTYGGGGGSGGFGAAGGAGGSGGGGAGGNNVSGTAGTANTGGGGGGAGGANGLTGGSGGSGVVILLIG